MANLKLLLAAQGWTPIESGTAIATKAFNTVNGLNSAHIFLQKDDAQAAWWLHAEYRSEGRNVLSNEIAFVNDDAALAEVERIVKKYTLDVEATIRNTYGVRLA